MEEEHLISVILSIIIAFMGWLMQRKTERIKIMENQLSEKNIRHMQIWWGFSFLY